MESQKLLEFMKNYAESFAEETKKIKSLSEQQSNSWMHFGMMSMLNAAERELEKEDGVSQVKVQDCHADDNKSEYIQYRIAICSCSFHQHRDAEAMRDKIRREVGCPAYLEQDGDVYRVYGGCFDTEREVIFWNDRLNVDGYVTSIERLTEKIEDVVEEKKNDNDLRLDVVKKHCEYIGDITLGETVVFADPAIRIRNIDRFTKIENVLPGTYEVFITQESVPTKDGKRINASDSLKFLHKEYENMKVASKGKVKTRIYTTMAGIFDLDAIEDFLKCKKLSENSTYNEWYQRAIKHTERYVKNPGYIPFERSAFWSDAFLELQNEEYSREVYRAYLTAKAQYDSLGIEKEILDMEYGGIMDDTGAVFGSANMLEEEISCVLEMNEDDMVISFKILVEDVELPNFDLVNKK